MAAGLEQRRDRGFTGQPALVRRTAVEAREAGFGFFNLDRVMRDPLRVFFVFINAIIQIQPERFRFA